MLNLQPNFYPFSLNQPGVRRSSVFRALFKHKNGLLDTGVQQDTIARKAAIFRYAGEFYNATVKKTGTDEDRIQDIFVQLHKQNALNEFNQAVMDIARQHNKHFNSIEDIIESEYAGNMLERLFQSAQKKELLDYIRHGKNLYRASAWEARRYGMWRSIADFITVCKQYPLMSAGVIGSVAYLGHKYPFLGGISGGAIIAWGLVVSGLNELKALFSPKNTPQKTEHYIRSGENLAAALITSVGFKGIRNGTINGLEQAREAIAAIPQTQQATRLYKGLATAMTATAREQHKTNLLESFLFVSGLFDNVLLPFNWVADKLKQKTR